MPALARDPVSRSALDAAKSLGVNVKHVSRRCMLVTLNSCYRIEKAQTSKTSSSAHSSGGGHARSDDGRDLPHRHPHLSKLDNPRSLLFADLIRLALRSRATVVE